MEKTTPWHNLNTSLPQNPLILKQSRSFSTKFGVLNVSTGTPLSAPLSSSSLNSLSNFCSFHNFNELNSLNLVKSIHAQIIKVSPKKSADIKMQSLITAYLELNDFQSAAIIFFTGFAQNYLYWNCFLQEFMSFGGTPFEILEVFRKLHSIGVSFNSRILAVILKICANVRDIWLGLEIHACLIKRGYDLDVHLKCGLMNFYGRCWSIESANQVFQEMPYQDALLWNEAILVNLRNERWAEGLKLFGEMHCSCMKVTSFTVAKVLQACAKLEALDEGKQIHGYIVRLALESNLLICNSLINMYSKNGNIELARAVFDSLQNRNLSSWNSIISGYMGLGYLDDAWKLFYEMERTGMKPNVITWNCLLSGHLLDGSYQEVLSILQKMQASGSQLNSSSLTSVLQVISESGILNFGKEVHGYAIRNSLAHDKYVGTSLLDMYIKNDNLPIAQAIFDTLKSRNIFAWNSLISGYAFKGQFEDAMKLLSQMESEGIEPDLVTYNGLVSGYSIWGRIEEALALIRRIKTTGLSPSVVSWTALISGCSQQGKYKDALEFSIQMQWEGVKLNSATILSLLQACAGLSLLQKGKEIHCLSMRNGFIEDVHVATALLDMYTKCGSLADAYEVFQRIQNKTLASWNSMIMGFAICSHGKEAISLFDEMREAGIQPDAITFTAILSSCKHSGLIDVGWKYFDGMSTDFGIIPTVEHYSCMVDLLGRAGYIDEAWEFMKTMPTVPDATVWGALLRTSSVQVNLKLAEIAAKNLFKLEPQNPANYVLMMNLYASLDKWEDVERIADTMLIGRVKKGQVWSWIQIGQRVHVFSVVGKPHPDEGEIYFELYRLISEIKSLGYVPDTKLVYQNINEVEKEKVLLSHTEKLAITYGLIKTKTSAPVRVIKNTSICSDCHTAAKYISLARNCEILITYGARLHHIQQGKCSCNDFW